MNIPYLHRLDLRTMSFAAEKSNGGTAIPSGIIEAKQSRTPVGHPQIIPFTVFAELHGPISKETAISFILFTWHKELILLQLLRFKTRLNYHLLSSSVVRNR